MPTDTTTFYLAFTAVFGAIAVYLYRLDRQMAGLAARLDAAEVRSTKDIGLASKGSEQE